MPPPRPGPADAAADRALGAALLDATVFVTGAAVLVIEIVGTRIVGPFFGATVFTWSALITVTLGMLAAGYWVGGLVADRRPAAHLFYLVIVAAGVFTALILPIQRPVLLATDELGPRAGPFFAALLVFSPSLFCLGMVSPFAIRLRTSVVERVGAGAGRVYALSTVGSVAGGLASGFVLLPGFSLTVVFQAVAAVLLATGLAGLLASRVAFAAPPAGAVPLGLALALLGAAAGVAGTTPADAGEARVVLHRQSFHADIKVIDVDGSRCLIAGGYAETCMDVESGVSEWAYVGEMAELAAARRRAHRAARPGEDFRILVIGLGGGNIVNELPADATVDVVEVDPTVAEVAQELFHARLDGGRRLVIDDVRRFLRRTPVAYDLVLGTAVSESLFSREYYAAVRARLRPGGVFLKLVEMQGSPEGVFAASVVRTARTVFPAPVLTSPAALDDADGLVDAVLHLSPDADYVPRLEEGTGYRVVRVNESRGRLVTDALNPFDVVHHRERLLARDLVLAIGGYAALFGS